MFLNTLKLKRYIEKFDKQMLAYFLKLYHCKGETFKKNFLGIFQQLKHQHFLDLLDL